MSIIIIMMEELLEGLSPFLNVPEEFVRRNKPETI